MPAGQPCHKVVINWGGIGSGGQFVNYFPYGMNWGVTEGVVDANNNYVPLAGAKFTVQYQRSLSKTPIDDNGPTDSLGARYRRCERSLSTATAATLSF